MLEAQEAGEDAHALIFRAFLAKTGSNKPLQPLPEDLCGQQINNKSN